MAKNIHISLNDFLLEKNEIKDKLKKYLIDGKYLFHYTLTENLTDILQEGLIPRKNPNSFYKDGAKGIFLTKSKSLYNANLPQSLMDEMDNYYNYEDSYDEKPIIRLWIDIDELNYDNFAPDDDYILNKYGWNKAVDYKSKIIESLDIWGSIAYLGIIPNDVIFKYDFEYFA